MKSGTTRTVLESLKRVQLGGPVQVEGSYLEVLQVGPDLYRSFSDSGCGVGVSVSVKRVTGSVWRSNPPPLS